jgi:hypothetical protein
VDSTYAIWASDAILRKTSPWLTRLGIRDLARGEAAEAAALRSRIFLLGFSWAASSLLEEITRDKPALLPEIHVVDFNPRVIEQLRKRKVRVVYGDITQRDVLLHAGVEHAEIIICSLPDILLKGASNARLLRQLRELNSRARIVVHAEKLADIPALYAAGASYVMAPRLLEAAELLSVIDAADNGLLDQKRKAQADELEDRQEVIA